MPVRICLNSSLSLSLLWSLAFCLNHIWMAESQSLRSVPSKNYQRLPTSKVLLIIYKIKRQHGFQWLKLIKLRQLSPSPGWRMATLLRLMQPLASSRRWLLSRCSGLTAYLSLLISCLQLFLLRTQSVWAQLTLQSSQSQRLTPKTQSCWFHRLVSTPVTRLSSLPSRKARNTPLLRLVVLKLLTWLTRQCVQPRAPANGFC